MRGCGDLENGKTLWRVARFVNEFIRRRRSLISAQRLERSDNPGNIIENYDLTLKGFVSWRTPSGLDEYVYLTQVCRFVPTAGLKVANAFGVQIH